MKYSHIVWDFNGTLIDDVAAGIASVNDMLAKRGLPTIESVKKYRSIMRFPIIDYYRDLGFDFSKESYSSLAVEWVAGYMKREKTIKLNDGVKKVIEELYHNKVKQVILSASEVNMLTRQLKSLNLYKYFDEIIGLDNIHAAGKSSLAADWACKEKPEYALFIGDTEHDYESALAASKYVCVDCILYTEGHGAPETLLKTGAKTVSRIADVVNIIYGRDFKEYHDGVRVCL